jgi:hypothetical protein
VINGFILSSTPTYFRPTGPCSYSSLLHCPTCFGPAESEHVAEWNKVVCPKFILLWVLRLFFVSYL